MKQAIILAAGEGQRLRPFTVSKPKAMISIADKPILAYVVEALARNGIRNIVLVVGYRREQVYDYLGSGEQFGVSVTYVTQEKQLGTAHALAQARSVANDEFLVVPGDKLIEADTIAGFLSTKPESLLVRRVDNPFRYAAVTVEDGMVKSIIEKPRAEQGNLIVTGIYSFSNDIFNYLDNELSILDALNNMIARGNHIYAYESAGVWLNTLYPWELLSLNGVILPGVPEVVDGTIESGVALRGSVSVGKDTVIRSNSYVVGPVVIGEGCEIGPNVYISPATSIGKNVVISPFTHIDNSVIGDDVSIGTGSIIEDSVIDRGSVIGSHFTACTDEAEVKIDNEYHKVKVGAMIGEGCHLAHCVIAQPGVIIGNHCQVKALKLVSGRLPDRSMVY